MAILRERAGASVTTKRDLVSNGVALRAGGMPARVARFTQLLLLLYQGTASRTKLVANENAKILEYAMVRLYITDPSVCFHALSSSPMNVDHIVLELLRSRSRSIM